MEGQSGLSELSVISWASAEGCPISEVPLYSYDTSTTLLLRLARHLYITVDQPDAINEFAFDWLIDTQFGVISTVGIQPYNTNNYIIICSYTDRTL